MYLIKRLIKWWNDSHTNDATIANKMNTYLTDDETNEFIDVLKGRIEILDAKNTSLKTMITVFEARIAVE